MKRFALLATVLLAALPLASQESAPHAPAPPRHFYRLNYVLKETEEGKVVNRRSFSLTSSSGDHFNPRLRAGSRFPVRDAEKVNYIDVGVNLDSHLDEGPDGLVVEVTAEISSPATEPTGSSASPVIRQVRTNALAIVALNLNSETPRFVFS